jgi:2-keto-4-pentenoate hydratase/2-oxohepta-3-ene-1,7-dioic acid hydratase in catechol pathway
MKFASIRRGRKATWGVVDGGDIALAPDAVAAKYPDLRAAIAANALRRAGKQALKDGRRVALKSVTLLPPVGNPDKIVCVGLNYEKHRLETNSQGTGRVYPPHPAIFARYANTLAAHGAPLVKPVNSDIVDYEGELAVVIGKGGRRISREDALSHVAGYSCYNDVSMRDWQMHTSQWIPGKNFPGSGPMGPYLVTPDEVGDIGALSIRTYVDGKLMQDAKFADLIFGLEQILEYISGFTDLVPGDIIVTGTPGGVGFTRKPPVLLGPGTVVEVDIEKVGRLVNHVVAEAA